MSGNDAEVDSVLTGRLEDIGRRLVDSRTPEELAGIQLELTVLEQWDRVMAKSAEGGHHHDHDDVPDVIDAGEVDDVIDAGEVNA